MQVLLGGLGSDVRRDQASHDDATPRHGKGFPGLDHPQVLTEPVLQGSYADGFHPERNVDSPGHIVNPRPSILVQLVSSLGWGRPDLSSRGADGRRHESPDGLEDDSEQQIAPRSVRWIAPRTVPCLRRRIVG